MRPTRMLGWMAAAGVAASGAAGTRAQDAAAGWLTLQVLAVDAAGAPARGLGPADLAVRLNGRIRSIRSMQFVSVDAPGPAHPGVPTAFTTNGPGADGRSVLIVVEDESIGPGDEGRLRESIEALLASLTPRDRVALLTVPHGGARVDWTTDFSRVRQALSTLTGRAARQTTVTDLTCQARQTLDAIAGAAGSVRSLGLPIVVVVSGGLMGPRRELEIIGTARAPSACDFRLDDFQRVARAAADTGAHFWVARAETVRLPLAPVEDAAGRSTNLLIGLEQLAGATRAPLLNLTGSDGTRLAEVARATLGYYLVTVDVDPSDRGDVPRSLEVRTTRPGVTVRAVPQIAVPMRAALPAAVTAPELLTVSGERRELPLRAVAYVTRESGTTLRIVARGESADDGASLAGAAIGLVDGQNRLAGQWVATAADLDAGLTAAFAAPPGAYRVRVAAVDAAGRAGTVDVPVVADLARAGTLSISDLMLGVRREAGFIPRLQFSTEPVATVYLEVYGAQGGASIHAVIELADSATGPARVTRTATFAATAEPDRFLATAALPIGALPPGHYVVRATMGLEGQATTRVARTLVKSGPDGR